MQDPGTPSTGLDGPVATDGRRTVDPAATGVPGDAQIDLGAPGEDADAEEPARGGLVRMVMLAVLLVAVVAGVTVGGAAAWRIWSQKDATLVPPAEVAGLRLDDSADGQANADYLGTALAADVDLGKTVGAVYADPGSGDAILFFGGTSLIWSPDSELQAAFDLISDGQGAVTGLHDVPAGKLGGTMRCGTTKTDDGDMPVCGWADHGCLAVAMFPGRPATDAARLMREIRDGAQTRG